MKNYIKECLLLVIVLLLCMSFTGYIVHNNIQKTNSIFLSNIQIDYSKQLMKKYKWLNKSLYKDIKYVCNYYDVDIVVICSLINRESNGRNVVSRKNRNGTRDYGLMQINSVHFPKQPKILLNRFINLNFGVNYFKQCFKRANKDLVTTIRFYNQGYNGNINYYKNWKYVEKIYNDYIKIKEMKNEK